MYLSTLSVAISYHSQGCTLSVTRRFTVFGEWDNRTVYHIHNRYNIEQVTEYRWCFSLIYNLLFILVIHFSLEYENFYFVGILSFYWNSCSNNTMNLLKCIVLVSQWKQWSHEKNHITQKWRDIVFKIDCSGYQTISKNWFT